MKIKSYDELREFIRHKMKAQGLSQGRLAKKCYLSPSTINKWLTGERKMDIEKCAAILNALGYGIVIKEDGKDET